MATVTIMQGDSYAIPIKLVQNGVVLTPDMVENVEVCIGESFRKTYVDGGVGFDSDTQRWFIKPTQQETLNLDADAHDVVVRVKYFNLPVADVIGKKVGIISVLEGQSEEVL